MKKLFTLFSLVFFGSMLMSACTKTYVCECEVEFKSGKTGYEYYPMEGRRNAMERKCVKGKVGDNLKYDRGSCELVD